MQDALHRVLLKTKEQILHITSVLYLLLGSPNVLSLADVPPKQLISFPDILRQTFQSLVPQFLRHPVKSFGNAAGDAGKAIAAGRHSPSRRLDKPVPSHYNTIKESAEELLQFAATGSGKGMSSWNQKQNNICS